jgi:hypothetical protein
MPVNAKFVNNTVDNCTRGVSVVWPSYLLGNVFWNNIVTNSTEYAIFVYVGDSDTHIAEKTHIDFEHNLYYTFPTFSNVNTNKSFSTWKANYTQDSASPASLNSNPLYVDGTNHNFRLCTANGVPLADCSGASPARNAGIDILDLDNDGSPTDTITMGAYITGNEIIGIARHVPYLHP